MMFCAKLSVHITYYFLSVLVAIYQHYSLIWTKIHTDLFEREIQLHEVVKSHLKSVIVT